MDKSLVYDGEVTVSQQEAAKMLGCTSVTVRKAIDAGKIKAFQFIEGGRYRISLAELERFINGDTPPIDNMKDHLASIDQSLRSLYSLFVDIRVALDKVIKPEF